MALTTRRVSAGAITKYTLVKLSAIRGRVEAWSPSDGVSMIAGVALANASASGVTIHVQEIPGLEAGALSDGHDVIEPGDLLVASPSIPGRVRVGMVDPIGVATSGADAIANADLTMIWLGSRGSSGGVSSVSGVAPIVSSGGTTPAISITAATTLAAGSMSAADKTKLDSLSSLSTMRTQLPAPVGTYTAPAGGSVFAIPIWIPPDVTVVRVRLQNMAYNESAYADRTANLAIGTNNNGDFAAAPTEYPGITIGGVVPYVSAWTPVTRGGDGKILIAVSAPAASAIQASSSINYTGRLVTGTETVYPLGGATAMISTFPYLLQVEYDTTVRRVVVIGDSISIGYNAYWDVPGLGASPYYGLSLDHGYATYVYGASAARMYNYADDVQSEMSASFGQTRQDLAAVIRGAVVVVEAGINDVQYATVAGGTTCYQSYKIMVEKLVTWLRALDAYKIIFETYSAASSYEGAHGAARVQFCDWIATLPFGIDAIIDRDEALSTPPRTAGAIMNPALDSGDGVHPNAAGEAILEAAAYAVISSFP